VRTNKEAGTPIRSLYIVRLLLISGVDLYEAEHLDLIPSRVASLVEGSLRAAQVNDKMISRRKKLIDPERTMNVILTTFDRAFLRLFLYSLDRCSQQKMTANSLTP
jgi:hypothetical protein